MVAKPQTGSSGGVAKRSQAASRSMRKALTSDRNLVARRSNAQEAAARKTMKQQATALNRAMKRWARKQT